MAFGLTADTRGLAEKRANRSGAVRTSKRTGCFSMRDPTILAMQIRMRFSQV